MDSKPIQSQINNAIRKIIMASFLLIVGRKHVVSSFQHVVVVTNNAFHNNNNGRRAMHAVHTMNLKSTFMTKNRNNVGFTSTTYRFQRPFSSHFNGMNNNNNKQTTTTTTTTTGIFMTTKEDDNDTTIKTTTTTIEPPPIKTNYNIPELKKEASRLTLRCHKKIGKASTRLSKANEQVQEIRTNPNATLEQLESCPNVKVLENDLNDLRKRLKSLNELEEKLNGVKSGKSVELPQDVLDLVLELEVRDEAPQRNPRPVKKKKKGPKIEAPRLPYFRYYTENNTEIRVSWSSMMKKSGYLDLCVLGNESHPFCFIFTFVFFSL